MRDWLILTAIALILVGGIYALTQTKQWKDARETEALCWAMGYQDSLYRYGYWWCIDPVKRIPLELQP